MNILGIGQDKSQSAYFSGRDQVPEYETERGEGAATPPGRARPSPCQGVVWWLPTPPRPLLLVFWHLITSGKIGTLPFVLSNSENIHFLTLLEPKTAENRQLTLCRLLIG